MCIRDRNGDAPIRPERQKYTWRPRSSDPVDQESTIMIRRIIFCSIRRKAKYYLKELFKGSTNSDEQTLPLETK